MKNKIALVLDYYDFKDLLNENVDDIPTPKKILEELDSEFITIESERLLHKALYTSLNQGNIKTSDILAPFIFDEDIDAFKSIFSFISTNYINSDYTYSIINTRSSLSLYRLAHQITTKKSNLTKTQKRIKLFKAYLLLNNHNRTKDIEPNADNHSLKCQLIENDLIYERYRTNYKESLSIQLSQIIKACEFFKFCESKIPKHLNIFYKKFNISSWKEYTINIHTLSILTLKSIINSKGEYSSFNILPEDTQYLNKLNFIECLAKKKFNFTDDKDYTVLKINPVRKISLDHYTIPFPPFFINLMFESLYFTFNTINNQLEGTEDYILNFKSNIGKKFSEEILFTKLIKSLFPRSNIHLNYQQLTQNTDPDYYLRNGNHILLFECKDNLIAKEYLETNSLDILIPELKKVFIEDFKKKKVKKKAIKQLINNINRIYNKDFSDFQYNPNNCRIYPIIIVHNKFFSNTGINYLVNRWFKSLIKDEKNIVKKNIINITIIDINTLISHNGLFKQSKYKLHKMIDRYHLFLKESSRKKYKTEEEIIYTIYKKPLISFSVFIEQFIEINDLKFNNHFVDSYESYYK
jgi:hypothetical protein